MNRFNQVYREEAGEPAGDGAAPPDAGAMTPAAAPDAPPVNYFAPESMPEDWRTQLAGENDTHAKYLERYTDMGAVIDAGYNAQDKIRKGEISTGLPDNPTDAQMTAYREANGIPATAAEYELKLADGVVLGEADKRMLAPVFDAAHANNLGLPAVNAITDAYFSARLAEVDARGTKDNLDLQQATAALREAWGNDYEPNLNKAKLFAERSFPREFREMLEGARMPDGTPLYSSPEFIIGLATAEREINPAGTVVPGASNPIAVGRGEYEELKAAMGTPEWYKDKAKQARFMELHEYLSNEQTGDPKFSEYG